MRERLRIPIIGSALYALWIAMFHWYAIPSGLMDASLGRLLIGYDLIGMLVFYPLIRSGLTARWHDPGLILAQVIAGTGACVVCYCAAPALRVSLLHLLCVIQVFGMVTLRPRATRIAGIGAVAMLLTMLATMLALAPAGFDAAPEMLKIALACFILGRLSMLSHDYSVVREKVAGEQQQLAQAVESVHELVVRDTLTGLFNRTRMQDLLASERERSGRTGAPYCVALIDLDHFKRINDTHGHQVGDDVLVGFAQAATAALRETDVICRWGGEEFLVMMRDTESAAHGLRALARLSDKLRQAHGLALAPELRVTFSGGLALAQPGEAPGTVIERADRALYAAKAAGRNRCLVADDLFVVAPPPAATAAVPA